MKNKQLCEADILTIETIELTTDSVIFKLRSNTTGKTKDLVENDPVARQAVKKKKVAVGDEVYDSFHYHASTEECPGTNCALVPNFLKVKIRMEKFVQPKE